MPSANFTAFQYYPSLLTSYGELTGYQQLSDADKSALMPIAAISWIGFKVSFEDTIGRMRACFGDRSFLLDLDQRPAPPPYEAADPQDPAAQDRRLLEQRAAQAAYNAHLEQTLLSTDGFAAWRSLAATFPNAVPVLQHRDFVAESAAILRQAARLANGGQSIAIRVNESNASDARSIIVQIVSILERPEQLLIIYDAGQGRRGVNERAQSAAEFISDLRSELDVQDASRVVAALISNSFTASVLNCDDVRLSPNLDRNLWEIARETFPFIYGDYAATPRMPHSSYIPSDSRSTVVYPLDNSWIIYRDVDLNDPQGWIEGSKAIVAHDEYDGPVEAWGQELINGAVDDNINDKDSPRFWRAAKVNLHIYRQLHFLPPSGLEGDPDWDEVL